MSTIATLAVWFLSNKFGKRSVNINALEFDSKLHKLWDDVLNEPEPEPEPKPAPAKKPVQEEPPKKKLAKEKSQKKSE